MPVSRLQRQMRVSSTMQRTGATQPPPRSARHRRAGGASGREASGGTGDRDLPRAMTCAA